MCNFETPAGQTFCGMHTKLGFIIAMNKAMMFVEADMKMEQVLYCFLGDPDLDSQNESVTRRTLSICLG
ncbi:hypothetical protein DPMN_043211 [Dreissena polymorpha]|uniref:Uncharacterized protein n=1 Tax=Dreissena polymorpha TaxID=45954 RepID=A0A9D4D2E2_DREPO|nr:hypothetical protein DPMN_043211 [Dreissena polymorpha]